MLLTTYSSPLNVEEALIGKQIGSLSSDWQLQFTCTGCTTYTYSNVKYSILTGLIHFWCPAYPSPVCVLT